MVCFTFSIKVLEVVKWRHKAPSLRNAEALILMPPHEIIPIELRIYN